MGYNAGIEITYELRPCMAEGQKALFHAWIASTSVGNLYATDMQALVERENGNMERCAPENVRFLDRKLYEYAWRPGRAGKAEREAEEVRTLLQKCVVAQKEGKPDG